MMNEDFFNLDKLLRDATDKTCDNPSGKALTDFGGEDFLPGLKKLLTTYQENGFSEKGCKRLRHRLVDLLAVRLKVEAAFKAHPEILDIEIKAPLFLTGLPRTGTSALLNLLANDRASRPLLLWEGFNPDPLPGNPSKDEDPRYLAMKGYYDQMNQNPEFKKIHATSPDTPEECVHLLNHTFQDVQFGIETMMEPYASWFQQQDLTASYNYYANLLRLLQWQRPGDRWLLKTPGHLWALNHLIRLFPDAHIIITHRNPLESVTSYASMMAALMKDRSFKKTELGPVVMEYLARKVERSLEQRESIPDHQIIDLHFKEFVDQPMTIVEKIYQHFDLPLSKQTLTAMLAYADDNSMGKHGKHEYQLAEFGLEKEQILDRFQFYLERFQIEIEES